MKLIYKSEVIENPTINLVNHLRDTIINLEGNTYDDTRDYIIKLDSVLFSVIQSEMCDPIFPVMVKGIRCVEDNNMEYGVYRIYKKDKSVKTKEYSNLDEWFTNLPLIYKIDLYNSMSGTITKHLK